MSAQRGKSYAKEFIKWIKVCSEASGMVVCLVANNYELSSSHTDKGGFFTETLLEAIELDSKQIIHHIDLNQDYIESFTEKKDSKTAKSFQIFPAIAATQNPNSFLWIPKSLDRDRLLQIQKVLV